MEIDHYYLYRQLSLHTHKDVPVMHKYFKPPFIIHIQPPEAAFTLIKNNIMVYLS